MSGNKGRIQEQRRQEIFDELRQLIETGAILGVTNQQLANQMGISRQTVSGYLKQLYEQIPEEQITEVRVKIHAIFKKLFRESQRMVSAAKTDKEKREAMDFLLKCIREFTDFLERFGRKPKAPENLNIVENRQEGTDWQEIADKLDEVKQQRREKYRQLAREADIDDDDNRRNQATH